MKQDLGLEISEGNKTISQEVFIFLEKKLFTSKKKDNIFFSFVIDIRLVSFLIFLFVRYFHLFY